MITQTIGSLCGCAILLSAWAAPAIQVQSQQSKGYPPGMRYDKWVATPSISTTDITTLTGPGVLRRLALSGRRAVVGLLSREDHKDTGATIVGPDGNAVGGIERGVASREVLMNSPFGDVGGSLEALIIPPQPPGSYVLRLPPGSREERETLVVQDAGYIMESSMPKMSYGPSETPVLHVYLHRDDGQPLLKFRVKVTPSTRAFKKTLLRDDGRPPDQTANDGIYTGELRRRRVRFGQVVQDWTELLVEATAVVDHHLVRRVGGTAFEAATGAVVVSELLNPSVVSSDGIRSLIVPLRLHVQSPDEYHVGAVLVGANDELIASAEAEVRLENPVEEMPLAFDAAAIVAAGIAPPYRLCNVVIYAKPDDGPVEADSNADLGQVGGFTLQDLQPPG